MTNRKSASKRPLEDISGLVAALAGKADDSNVVHKTGNETIAGIKTFGPEVHVVSSNTGILPAVYLNNSAQEWSQGINSSGQMYIYDETGSKGPFRIYPGTPTDTFVLNATGLSTSQPIDMVNNRIIRVGTPTATTDAATKDYVDTLLGGAVRRARRAVVVTQAATPAINTDAADVVQITGLAQAITSLTTNLTGSPVAGDQLQVEITDNGTSRALTWGAKFESSTSYTLPTSTVANIKLIAFFVWNTATSAWRIVGHVGFQTWIDGSTAQTLTNKVLTSPSLNTPIINSYANTNTTSSATALVLTSTSNFLQQITGTSTQVVTLPTTSVLLGRQFLIDNQSAQAATINASGGTLVATVPAGASVQVTARIATPTTNAHWLAQVELSATQTVATQTVSIATIGNAQTLGSQANNQYIVLLASGAAPTLPTAVNNTSVYVLKNISGGAITPATTSSQNIEGAAPTALANGYSWTLVSDQTGWRII